ncbi:MAG: hypothetical protein HQ578_06385 [Chloroflexi bacterium]|nr:hypothetical protein [Chloroflexota bacterium]
MSHTSRVLKEIAASEEYGSLETAVEQGDYEAMFDNYMSILEGLKGGRETIEESIENLPVQNKGDRRDKFSHAFEVAIERILPVWSGLDRRLKSGLSRSYVMEGEVFGFGKKGDPLVRTPEGVIVVLKGSELEQGGRALFRVVQETEKLSFGKVFELNRQSFYFLITQEAHDRIQEALELIDDRLSVFQESENEGLPSELGDLLQELEEIRKLCSTLRARERDAVTARVVNYRKRLLFSIGTKIMFDFISRREEEDIDSFYQDGKEEKAKALSAVGLFRHYTYAVPKQKLLLGDEPEGYVEMLNKMNDEVDSMHSAMEFLEFKSAVDDVYPKAKRYLEKTDRLFSSLVGRANRVTEAVSKEDVVDPDKIRLAIERVFAEETLFSELRKAFQSSQEFFSLRGAFAELNRNLGDQESVATEAAFRSYLRHKILQAFGSEGSGKRQPT